MKQAKANVLKHLAVMGYNNITRGQLVVSIPPTEIPIYESLHKSRHIRRPQTKMFGNVYQLTKKGWKALTVEQRAYIITEYQIWVNTIKPTIKGPDWLEWTE